MTTLTPGQKSLVCRLENKALPLSPEAAQEAAEMIRALITQLDEWVPPTCLGCGGRRDAKRSDSLFCCARCKANYHRHRDPGGKVRSVRRLMHGRVSVVVWFDEHEAPRALTFTPNLKVVMGSDEEP